MGYIIYISIKSGEAQFIPMEVAHEAKMVGLPWYEITRILHIFRPVEQELTLPLTPPPTRSVSFT